MEFDDGAWIELNVDDEETVAEAAMRQDSPLRVDCLSGECGACLAHCSDSSQILRNEAPVITASEATRGLVATCRTRLRGQASFRLDYPLSPRPSEPAKLRGEVARHDRLCETVSRLIIELHDCEEFVFQAGQYLRLRPPGLRVARPYSIASTMADLPFVELLIRHVPGGQVSGWLNDRATAGDKVTVQAPLGGFAADTRAARQIFLAGGTGLAPVLSMIREQAQTGRDLTLCFGCSSPAELFMYDELQELAHNTPSLDVRIALLRDAAGPISEGTALSLLRDTDFTPETSFHLCGPPPMIASAQQIFEDRGVADRRIRAERFLASV
ncbi:hypothetical protein MB02_02655 [Croceicoccus estronivorus]|uniref:2Fe-2S iron-sulfur cluster binding domain-containing protein n=1 Tax=Croceicoccus estronivorus TaxID=1172626 RepID=UPI00082BAFE1|nr:2Fe-2S iron-sulfur cluster binding domain-containing protein [Croceicoccus estronivorus]OCC25550.1 hypothetical protein MB02_02655 [Croceicoccus estronivorus]